MKHKNGRYINNITTMNSRMKDSDGKNGNKHYDSLYIIALVLIVAFFVSLIPLLMIGAYDFPSADDFSTGAACRLIWEQSHNIFAVMGKALSIAYDYYFTWMGYFVNIFFTSIQPGIYGDFTYAMVPFVILGTLIVATFLFFRALLTKLLGFDNWISNVVSVIALFLMIQCMPFGETNTARVEAFYWHAGAINYTFMHSLSLLFMAFTIFYAKERKHIYLILASVFGFMCGGGNQMTGLNTCIIVTLACAFLILHKRLQKRSTNNSVNPVPSLESTDGLAEIIINPSLFVSSICFYTAFLLNVFAPGNRVRSAGTNGLSPIASIVQSLTKGFELCFIEWFGWKIVAFMLLLLPFIVRGLRNTRFRFPCPLVVVVFSFGIVCAMLTPPLFAVGNVMAGRIQSLTYIMFVLWIIIDEIYVVGWFIWRKSNYSMGKYETVIAIAGMLAILCLSIFFVHVNPHYYSFSSAITDMREGVAKGYRCEIEKRLELLHDNEVLNPEFEAFENRPALLFFSDITTDTEAWENRALARYYEKESTVVR